MLSSVQLPLDILGEIFKHAVVDDDYPTPLKALKFSHVSSRWRDAALSCPTLWNYDDPQYFPGLCFCHLKHLENSCLLLHADLYGPGHERILRGLLPLHQRISHIDIQIPLLDIQRFLSRFGPSRLTSVIVRTDDLVSGNTLEVTTLPLLTNMELRVERMTANFSGFRFTSLTSVEVSNMAIAKPLPISNILSAMSPSFPSILHLSLSNITATQDELINVVCSLTAVKTLAFYGREDLFLNALLPALSSVTKKPLKHLASLVSISMMVHRPTSRLVPTITLALSTLLLSWMSVPARRRTLRSISLKIVDSTRRRPYQQALDKMSESLRPWLLDGPNGGSLVLDTGLLDESDRSVDFFDWVKLQ
ncbi:hypothetical protein DXG01_016827 [Tephrocybe rancida]|nr:hypothetical protein DXG01_016827 [Tephrocybe rancida]